jgi:hypothetical protein
MAFRSSRTVLLSALAFVASVLAFTVPASALTMQLPADEWIFVVSAPHHDLAAAVEQLNAVIDKAALQSEAAFFLHTEPEAVSGGAGGQKFPFDLKPEYAASYKSHGLGFIDVRLRC